MACAVCAEAMVAQAQATTAPHNAMRTADAAGASGLAEALGITVQTVASASDSRRSACNVTEYPQVLYLAAKVSYPKARRRIAVSRCRRNLIE